MPEKISFALKEIPASTPASDLRRMADALERIAVALEKLTLLDSSSLPTPDLPSQKVTERAQEPNHTPKTPTPQSRPVAPLPKKNSNSTSPAVSNTEKSVLRKYLKEQGITIQEPKPKSPEEEAYRLKLEQLALYLGHNFAACQELYKLLLLEDNIKPPCNAFNYTPKQTDTKKIRQFCHLLRGVQLLEIYNPPSKPEFTIKLKATGKEYKYLSGSWLELYLKQEVKRIVLELYPNQRYEFFSNLDIIFKDSTNSELDLFFAVGKKVFCVEAKMRPSEGRLREYLNRIKPLGLDPKAILIVVADKSEEECQKLSQNLDNVLVARLDNLEQTLKSMLAQA